jgi:hypothetical protein
MPRATESKPFALLAEFESAEQLVAAAEAAVEAGYRQLEAYSPYPIDELPPALNLQPTRLPALVLAAGIASGLAAYGLQYWTTVIDYPLNVGGKPLHDWPAFVSVTFELAILGAAVAAVVGMILFVGLPRPHHPLFHSSLFARASQDRFLLAVEANDPQFDDRQTREFLESHGAQHVEEVRG